MFKKKKKEAQWAALYLWGEEQVGNENVPPMNNSVPRTPTTPTTPTTLTMLATPTTPSHNSNTATDSESQLPSGLQGYKRSRRGCLDEHFKEENHDFLEAMVVESDKRALHDEALLAWDKEKHNVLPRFEIRKHRECMAQ